MADQKTEEPKIPAPRRGPRPFAGPAGASSAARPLLRPAAPGNRPAPFAPPTPPDRSTLGTPSTPRSAPPLVPPIAPAIETAPLAPAPVHPVQATPVEAAIPAPTFDVTFTSESSESRESVLPNAPEEPPVASIDAHSEAPATARPVTSEVVAIDAFDAFDAVWGSPDPTAAPTAAEPTTPPLDEISLGTGVDAQQLWADEITNPPENVRSVTPPTSHQVDIDSIGTEWTSAASDPGMPAWLADDSPPSPSAAETALDGHDDVAAAATPIYEAPAAPSAEGTEVPVPSGERWPDQLLAEYAPYIPTPNSVAAIKPQGAVPEIAEPPAMSAPLAEPPVFPAAPTPAEAAAENLLAADVQLASWTTHGARVSAALDRLAERVRSGEIDVSSVAPEAPDAAVLASVLAALLGGSSSR